MDNETPLTALEYGHKVKIKLALTGLRLAKKKAVRAYWQTTLDTWNDRARLAGYADAAAWLAAS